MYCIGKADEVEYRLIRDLLRNYDPRIRPSLNASEPLNVTFGLALAQIIDVVCIVYTMNRVSNSAMFFTAFTHLSLLLSQISTNTNRNAF